MKIFNTLTRAKEEILPVSGDVIRIYSCGLTVYDYAHIGNLRKYIFDDVLVRCLKYFGYKVKHVQNVTDVGHLVSDEDEGEDKIEKGAAREGKSAWEIARFFEQEFIKDLKKLNIILPDEMPRATENIQEQINLIKTLEEKGFTYRTSDGVYFDTSKLSDYGKLAKLDIENLEEGSRVEKNPEKKNPTDFALWKFSQPVIAPAHRSLGEGGSAAKQSLSSSVIPSEVEGSKKSKRQMEWESPWGVGFPGWHLECSAMSTKFLGQPFEIHTGGVDHIPVHHTNEIAQSEAAYDRPLAKYWVHSEHLLENGRKMAKSDGHFIRLRDLEEKGYSPLDFRYLCLTASYRSKLDFSWNSLEGARSARKRINDAYNSSSHPEANAGPAVILEPEAKRSDIGDLTKFDAERSESNGSLRARSTSSGQASRGNLPVSSCLPFEALAKEGAQQSNLDLKQSECHPELVEGSISLASFDSAIADDLDTPKALAFIFENLSKLSKSNFTRIDEVLGILEKVEIREENGIITEGYVPQDVFKLALKRQKARVEKNFAKSDELREKILQKGFLVEDTSDGPKISVVSSRAV